MNEALQRVIERDRKRREQEMGVNFQYQKFYFNENTKQAIGVIAKADTVTWGKCMVVEVASPGKLGIIYPMKLDQDTTGWHEIPETEFKRLQIEYGSDAVIQTAATAESCTMPGQYSRPRRRKRLKISPTMACRPSANPFRLCCQEYRKAIRCSSSRPPAARRSTPGSSPPSTRVRG